MLCLPAILSSTNYRFPTSLVLLLCHGVERELPWSKLAISILSAILFTFLTHWAIPNNLDRHIYCSHSHNNALSMHSVLNDHAPSSFTLDIILHMVHFIATAPIFLLFSLFVSPLLSLCTSPQSVLSYHGCDCCNTSDCFQLTAKSVAAPLNSMTMETCFRLVQNRVII